MANVDKERKLQNRVKSWIINDLGYTFLGNLEDQNNRCIKPELLKKNLGQHRTLQSSTHILETLRHSGANIR